MQECRPAGAVLGGGDVQDLAVSAGVDADRDQSMVVDDAAPSRTFPFSAWTQTKE